jgi:hypothetical protein
MDLYGKRNGTCLSCSIARFQIRLPEGNHPIWRVTLGFQFILGLGLSCVVFLVSSCCLLPNHQPFFFKLQNQHVAYLSYD